MRCSSAVCAYLARNAFNAAVRWGHGSAAAAGSVCVCVGGGSDASAGSLAFAASIWRNATASSVGAPSLPGAALGRSETAHRSASDAARMACSSSSAAGSGCRGVANATASSRHGTTSASASKLSTEADASSLTTSSVEQSLRRSTARRQALKLLQLAVDATGVGSTGTPGKSALLTAASAETALDSNAGPRFTWPRLAAVSGRLADIGAVDTIAR